MERWVEGTVVGQTAWTPTLYSLLVSAPIDPFIAGQFTQVGLKVDDKILFRPYSFVNAPHEDILEFYYTVLPHGQLTPLLQQLKVGDNLFVARRASGRFTLEHVPQANILWLLATGTGLGVFLSLLKTPVLWERFSSVVLAHSVRQAAQLSYQETIHRIEIQYKERFHYVPVVTQEKLLWAFSERFPALLSSKVIEKKIGLTLTPDNSQVMLCGSPAMIRDVINVLENRGLMLHHPGKTGQITIENYWKA